MIKWWYRCWRYLNVMQSDVIVGWYGDMLVRSVVDYNEKIYEIYPKSIVVLRCSSDHDDNGKKDNNESNYKDNIDEWNGSSVDENTNQWRGQWQWD